MSAEENKVVICRLVEEVYNRGDLDVADDVYNHPAVEEHRRGIGGFKHVIEWGTI